MAGSSLGNALGTILVAGLVLGVANQMFGQPKRRSTRSTKRRTNPVNFGFGNFSNLRF